MENLIEQINERLLEIIEEFGDSKVKEAMKYSLMAGGKRIRPVMMLQVIRSYDKNYQDYLDIACAIEMIHTYSLIHDDLPGMDNDDLRRGRLTCHKQFDEATAILAGDALLNEAVNVIIKTKVPDELKISLLATLYQASGINGMILGQALDMEYETKLATRDQLDLIHHHKTGDLISAAMKMGALIANPDDQKTWVEIGYKIGLAFQIQDDILDIIGDEKELGKPIGSDAQNDKTTYATLLGIDKAKADVEKLTQSAISQLDAFEKTEFLKELALKLVNRKK